MPTTPYEWFKAIEAKRYRRLHGTLGISLPHLLIILFYTGLIAYLFTHPHITL